MGLPWSPAAVVLSPPSHGGRLWFLAVYDGVMADVAAWRAIRVRNEWTRETIDQWRELEDSYLGVNILVDADLPILESLFCMRDDIRLVRERLCFVRQESKKPDGPYSEDSALDVMKLEQSLVETIASLQVKVLRMEQQCGLTPESRTMIEKRHRTNLTKGGLLIDDPDGSGGAVDSVPGIGSFSKPDPGSVGKGLSEFK